MTLGRARMRWITASTTVLCLALTGCTNGSQAEEDDTSEPAPTPATSTGECGELTIAYSPRNGYEASALIVGSLAESELGCKVTYAKVPAREAWRRVARGDADVYLDAYGNDDLRERLAGEDGPVTIVGPNGIRGGVDLAAPQFMATAGLETSRDLPDVDDIGWGFTSPVITTVPELMPLAKAFVDFENLDEYAVRDYTSVGVGEGMGDMLQQASLDDEKEQPNLYLVQGPRGFLGDAPGRHSVAIPGSSAQTCELEGGATLCSFDNFPYLKIVNTKFAESGSPAYNLVYKYRLSREEAVNVLEIVRLSGYAVEQADATAWINTHEKGWQRWLD